ncbi:MAG: hypothetical protein FWH34_03900 [Desulfovibrionaceae bacterium]|nr:hypothetical protein [Desulfovibrionaceae bacterium]
MKRYVNTSGGELAVYADSKFTSKIGTLYKGSACSYILTQEGAVAVLYRLSGGAYKIGFTDYLEGAQDE